MTDLPRPPKAYQQFIDRFPKAGQAWDLLAEAAEAAGPLSPRDQRLIKLAIAVGAFREGATHSAARKALATGVTQEQMEQVVALAAPTIGLPSAVAAHQWVLDITERRPKKNP
jgi:alkylhydroperoxidase/carboxymuconolactone decarboxylase family protein YurZ